MIHSVIHSLPIEQESSVCILQIIFLYLPDASLLFGKQPKNNTHQAEFFNSLVTASYLLIATKLSDDFLGSSLFSSLESKLEAIIYTENQLTP